MGPASIACLAMSVLPRLYDELASRGCWSGGRAGPVARAGEFLGLLRKMIKTRRMRLQDRYRQRTVFTSGLEAEGPRKGGNKGGKTQTQTQTQTQTRTQADDAKTKARARAMQVMKQSKHAKQPKHKTHKTTETNETTRDVVSFYLSSYFQI